MTEPKDKEPIILILGTDGLRTMPTSVDPHLGTVAHSNSSLETCDSAIGRYMRQARTCRKAHIEQTSG